MTWTVMRRRHFSEPWVAGVPQRSRAGAWWDVGDLMAKGFATMVVENYSVEET